MTDFTKKMFETLKAQWKQPSTLQGITVVAGVIGVTLTPEWKETIITVGTCVFTVVSIFVSEGSKDK